MIDILIMLGCLWYVYHGVRYGSSLKALGVVSFVPLLFFIPLHSAFQQLYSVPPAWVFSLAEYPVVYVVWMVIVFCGILYISFEIKRKAGVYDV